MSNAVNSVNQHYMFFNNLLTTIDIWDDPSKAEIKIVTDNIQRYILSYIKNESINIEYNTVPENRVIINDFQHVKDIEIDRELSDNTSKYFIYIKLQSIYNDNLVLKFNGKISKDNGITSNKLVVTDN